MRRYLHRWFEESLERARQGGRHAATHGLPRTSCEFANPQQRAAWFKAYDEASS